MTGPETFSNPFDAAPGRNPSVIGSGRGRNGSDNHSSGKADGHSPTSRAELQPNRSNRDSAAAAVLIRRLPPTMSAQTLRSMLLFSRECDGCDFVASSPTDDSYATAIARFRSAEGAQQARDLLHGRPTEDGMELKVEILSLTPGGTLGNQWATDGPLSDGVNSRIGSKFENAFRDLDRISPRLGDGSRHIADGIDGVSPTFKPLRMNAQSPIGHGRNTGRSVIQEDDVDDETARIMDNPVSFLNPDNQHLAYQRRATAPTIPSGLAERLGGLNINSNVGSSGTNNSNSNGLISSPLGLTSPRGYGGQGGAWFGGGGGGSGGLNGVQHNPRSSISNVTSPTSRYPPGIQSPVGFSGRQGQYFPPVNPADQNPPCNTLYVGNLPADTSEDELKALFSKQRGYKRMCFRTKQNGPMCFVEFEEVQWATRALSELYGVPLSNSVRGGIRLSFSKNPLGVRGPPQQSPVSPNPNMHSPGPIGFVGGPVSNGYGASNGQSFSTASGPPPGLPPPSGYPNSRGGGNGGGVHSGGRNSGINGNGQMPREDGFGGFYGPR